MNRRKAIWLLLIACFCILGGTPLYWLQTQHAHGLMRARLMAELDESQLQKLEFQLVNGEVADPDFALLEDGREVRLGDHYYDIYKSAEVDGKRIYWVIADALENALLARMQTDEGQDSPMSAAAKTVLKFLGLSFPAPYSPEMSAIAPLIAHGSAYRMHAPQVALDILSPPPQA